MTARFAFAVLQAGVGIGLAHAQVSADAPELSFPAVRSDLFVSLTTLAAPREAKKAYQRASREAGRKKPDFVKAARELEKALTIYPGYAAAWYFLGGTQLVRNDVEGARQAFQNAIAADPRFPYPYLPLADIEFRAEHFADAARLTETAVRLEPRLVEAHYMNALANSVLGHRDRARQSIRAVLAEDGDRRYPSVYLLLGDLSAAEGNFASAAEECRRLLEMKPSSPAADLARKRLAEWKAQGKL